MHRLRSTFVLSTLLALAAGTLSADPLPITAYSAVVLLDAASDTSGMCPTGCEETNDVFAPGTYSLGGYSGTGEVVLGPIPFVHAFSSSSTFADVVNAAAGLNYYFEFVGPAAGPIPVDIDVVLHTAINGISLVPSDGATAGVALGGPVSKPTGVNVHCNLLDCTDPDFTGTLHASLSANTVYILEMGAGSKISHGDEGANAFADPHLYIDPSFANAADYQFVVSDGVGNQTGLSSVPEPSYLALIGLAFGAVAVLRRLCDSLLQSGARTTD